MDVVDFGYSRNVLSSLHVTLLHVIHVNSTMYLGIGLQLLLPASLCRRKPLLLEHYHLSPLPIQRSGLHSQVFRYHTPFHLILP
jgi:hypothetical protein